MPDLTLTIIIPAFNSSATIAATLKSIVMQGFESLECWVIDGGSSDGTLELLQEFSAGHPFIHYLSEPDQGIYDAMNKGIRLARGEYLYFMGSDDVFADAELLSELFGFSGIRGHDLIYGDVILKHSGIRQGEEKDYFKIIRNLENICHQAIFYSRRVFEKFGPYDLNFPIYADFNLNVKCFKDKELSRKYVPRIVCIFNEKGMSWSQRGKDGFIQDLHESYVNEHEDKLALYVTSRFLEKQVAEIMTSRDYRIGRKIGNWVRIFRKLTRRKPAGPAAR